MGQFGIGQPIKRFEDQRLLRGEGRFHNDVNLPGQTHAVIVRSTHAHARIRSIDTAAALASPGVVAVFTGADVARDNLGTMQMTLKRKRPDGSPMFASPHRGLTADRVRYVGDPVAMVIAELRPKEDAVIKALGATLRDANQLLTRYVLEAFEVLGTRGGARFRAGR
jgi:carbon-monoxide dehydrogenase large subunit